MEVTLSEKNSPSLPKEANNLLVCTLEPLAKHAQFAEWPLHVTVVPWFTLPEQMRPAFINRVTNLTHRLSPITITGDEEAWFGERHDIRVMKVRHMGALATLHSELLHDIEESGSQVFSEWLDDEYAPHVTFHDGQSLETGESAELKEMQYIRMDMTTRRKVVEHVFTFGHRK